MYFLVDDRREQFKKLNTVVGRAWTQVNHSKYSVGCFKEYASVCVCVCVCVCLCVCACVAVSAILTHTCHVLRCVVRSLANG